VLVLSACTGARIRAYTGPEQSPDHIAILRHQTGFNNPSVYFVRIDDLPFARRQYADVELLPGRHEVAFGYEAVSLLMTYSFSTKNAWVTFDAEAGHEYEARVQKLPSNNIWAALAGQGRWMGIIVELHTGNVVASSLNHPPAAPTSTASEPKQETE